VSAQRIARAGPAGLDDDANGSSTALPGQHRPRPQELP